MALPPGSLGRFSAVFLFRGFLKDGVTVVGSDEKLIEHKRVFCVCFLADVWNREFLIC